jgi:hypothetical protein
MITDLIENLEGDIVTMKRDHRAVMVSKEQKCRQFIDEAKNKIDNFRSTYFKDL